MRDLCRMQGNTRVCHGLGAGLMNPTYKIEMDGGPIFLSYSRAFSVCSDKAYFLVCMVDLKKSHAFLNSLRQGKEEESFLLHL
jgi:hypothetical protein